MGTNYYASWNFQSSTGGPAHIEVPNVTVGLHICKSLVMFQGQVFNSWQAWRNFLTRNEWMVTIRDEYGKEHSVPDFVRMVEGTSVENRRRQFDWVAANATGSNDWLDVDQFSFYAGEFS